MRRDIFWGEWNYFSWRGRICSEQLHLEGPSTVLYERLPLQQWNWSEPRNEAYRESYAKGRCGAAGSERTSAKTTASLSNKSGTPTNRCQRGGLCGRESHSWHNVTRHSVQNQGRTTEGEEGKVTQTASGRRLLVYREIEPSSPEVLKQRVQKRVKSNNMVNMKVSRLKPQQYLKAVNQILVLLFWDQFAHIHHKIYYIMIAVTCVSVVMLYFSISFIPGMSHNISILELGLLQSCV